MRTHIALGHALALAAVTAAATPAFADPPPPAAPPPAPPASAAPPPYSPYLGPPPSPAPDLGQGAASPWILPPSLPPTHAEIEQFRSKKRMILAGAIVFGLAWYGALTAASVGITRNTVGSYEYIPALIPVVGPFISAPYRAVPNPPQEADYAGMTLMLALGVTQAVGAGVFIAGLRMPTGRAPAPCADETSARKAPCPAARLSVAPIVSPAFGGAGLVGTF